MTFLSDWHVGSGAGIPGNVDRQVLRDAEGLPYVPGKTLTGVLRDAAEWIADTHDAQSGGSSWRDALTFLFGGQPESHGGEEGAEAKPAALSVGSAVLPEEVRNYIKGNGLVPDLFIVQPGVSIDPQTGRSMPDHLFSTEKVRKNCVLRATLRVADEETKSGTGALKNKNAADLLEAAVKAVRRIGGSRRRGAGECRFEWAEDKWKEDKGKEEERQKTKAKLPSDCVADDALIALDFRLTTLQPVVIGKATLGNAVESETTIPGSVLLSYFANDIFGGGDVIQEAIQTGNFSVGNFLPEFDGRPSYPVPLSFGKRKKDGRISNRLLPKPDDAKESASGEDREKKADDQVQDLRTGVITLDESGTMYHSFEKEIRILRTHNTVADDVQRPTEKVGGLFTYEAIRAGTPFRGVLKMRGSLWNGLQTEIKEKLAWGETAIGRSRKDEYGRVRIEFLKEVPASGVPDLLAGKEDNEEKKKYLVVYLLSDVLVRGRYQEYSTRPEDLKSALESALDLTLNNARSPFRVEIGNYTRVGRRESWQVKWKLPRPSLVYFQAGSVLVYEVENPGKWKPEAITAVMNTGIGERRAEGYGRIWINPPFLCEPKSVESQTVTDSKNDDSSKPFDAKACKEDLFIKLLEREHFKKHFTRTARREIYMWVHGKNEKKNLFSDIPGEKRPSASQFGNLREAAALKGENYLEVIKGVAEKKTEDGETRAKESWDEKWRKWLKSVADAPESVWEWGLTENGSRQRLKEIEEYDSLTHFALRTFFDILCEAVFDLEKNKKRPDANPARGQTGGNTDESSD
jgi:CRISPR-associated protein Csx10